MSPNGRTSKISFSRSASARQVQAQGSPFTAANPDTSQRPLGTFARHHIRRLSDIREVSGSSKDGNVRRKLSRLLDGTSERKVSKPTSQLSSHEASAEVENITEESGASRPVTPPPGLGSMATSNLSLSVKDVPTRRSSAGLVAKSTAAPRKHGAADLPSWPRPTSSISGQVVPPHGRANSPVRNSMDHGPISSDTVARSPSKTFVRTSPPLDILELKNTRHGCIDMRLQTPASLFVGGGTIEGHVLLTVKGVGGRNTKSKALSISRLSIDVLGVEEVTDGRRWIFLSLATELFDEQHPPPASLVTTQVRSAGTELCWPLKTASTTVPFCMDLPLSIGPPPYESKQARIRYVLCATAAFRQAGKLAVIRQSFEVQVLTVFDPEKALSSLPTPLIASDQLSIPGGVGRQNIRLTAGLHRQTWVHGAMLFVDVHVVNNSSKTLKRIEVQLEKTTLWYSHAAAGTLEESATHLRLPKRSDNEVVCTYVIKKSKDWKGVPPHASEVRSCNLEVPQGHVTISTGRYFEVRYFLNVIVPAAMFKTIAVQLPVTIIHINSLDIVPNSLAQVAASIEAKRARTVPAVDESIYPPFYQGQAFAAPRRQSLEQMREEPGGDGTNAILSLTRELDGSPRRYFRASTSGHGNKATMSARLSEKRVQGRQSTVSSSHHHPTRHNSCYRCHLQEIGVPCHRRRRSSASSLPGPRLPRLQLSTSGLRFSDTEFEMAPDSPPRKVMLSESERDLILHQRELRLERKLSQRSQQHGLRKKRSRILPDARGAESQQARQVWPPTPGNYWGWRNVAVQPLAVDAASANHEPENTGEGRSFPRINRANMRSRPNTGPGRLGLSASDTSLNMPGQVHGHRGGRKRGSGERARSRTEPGTRSGLGFRKSVENW